MSPSPALDIPQGELCHYLSTKHNTHHIEHDTQQER